MDAGLGRPLVRIGIGEGNLKGGNGNVGLVRWRGLVNSYRIGSDVFCIASREILRIVYRLNKVGAKARVGRLAKRIAGARGVCYFPGKAVAREQ